LVFENISQFLQFSIASRNFLSETNRKEFSRYYSSSIKNFDQATIKNYEEQTKEINEIIKNKKNLKILDIGTGCGTEAIWFAMNNADVTSIDIKDKRLKVAEERKHFLENKFHIKLNLNLLNDDFFEFHKKFDSEPFDVIWLEQAYHHIEPREKLIPALRDLLKKDGYLIFSEANALNPFIQISLYCYRMVSFKSIFKGYKTIDIWINSKGNKQTYGVERITRKSTLKKSLKKNNFEIKSEKFFRVFPNKTYLRSLYFIEKLPSKIFPFIFSHYNIVSKKLGV
tara:strand:- start:402 stop:1250 length:849 start_codon:yes stop_codon:yes gene_type:complete